MTTIIPQWLQDFEDAVDAIKETIDNIGEALGPDPERNANVFEEFDDDK